MKNVHFHAFVTRSCLPFAVNIMFKLSITCNLVPRAFSLRKWEGPEKALASAGRFFFLIGWLQCYNQCNFYANVVKFNFILKMGASKGATPTKIFPRNPFCMLCLESKDSHSYFFTHNFWVFFGSCDRPMPRPFPALPIFSGKKPWERGCITCCCQLEDYANYTSLGNLGF